jgi:hypothetical protein
MTISAGNTSGRQDAGSSWKARLAILCVFALGAAMLAPATAAATTVFFDDFESGRFGANWWEMPAAPGVDVGAWWSVSPRGQHMPVSSGNYAIGVYTEPGHYSSQTAHVLMGPFQLAGKPNPRVEFDLYRNMTDWDTSPMWQRPTMRLAFTAYNADLSQHSENLIAYMGTSGGWQHIVVPLDKWGSEQAHTAWEMKNITNYFSPVLLSFDLDYSTGGLSERNPLSWPQPGEGAFIDNVKVAYGAPEVASVVRYPNKSSISAKRKRYLTLSTLVRDSRGGASYGAYSILQTSKNGRSGWKNTYKMYTNSDGMASKAIRPTKKGTTYYRWVVGSRKTAKQKVVVK